MRGFVEVEGDIVTEETNGKGETGNTTAADGYGEGFLAGAASWGRIDHKVL